MKNLFIVILLLSVTGCTFNYIHGTDVVLHQTEQGFVPLEAPKPKD